MLNDASWASFRFFNNNIFPNRIRKDFTIQLNFESNGNITVIIQSYSSDSCAVLWFLLTFLNNCKLNSRPLIFPGSQVNPQKLAALQRVLQSDFLNAVREVYESVYDTVDVSGNPELRANATAKVRTKSRFNIVSPCLAP